MSSYDCPICEEKDVSITWTDTHGVAQCWNCGAPCKVLHYVENKRIEKPTECILHPEFFAIARRFWKETGAKIYSGCSFPGGQELATAGDLEAWKKWKAENLKEVEVAMELIEAGRKKESSDA